MTEDQIRFLAGLFDPPRAVVSVISKKYACVWKCTPARLGEEVDKDYARGLTDAEVTAWLEDEVPRYQKWLVRTDRWRLRIG